MNVFLSVFLKYVDLDWLDFLAFLKVLVGSRILAASVAACAAHLPLAELHLAAVFLITCG